MFIELTPIYLQKKPSVFMYSTYPSREVDHFLGWTASRSGTVITASIHNDDSEDKSSYVQSRTSPLHAQFSFDDCSVPLNFFKYITSDSSLRLSQQPYYRFFPPTEWCCLCDPLISVLVKYCRFPFLYTVTSRFSGSIIH